MGEGLQWFFSTIVDLPGGGLQWGGGLQYNTTTLYNFVEFHTKFHIAVHNSYILVIISNSPLFHSA